MGRIFIAGKGILREKSLIERHRNVILNCQLTVQEFLVQKKLQCLEMGIVGKRLYLEVKKEEKIYKFPSFAIALLNSKGKTGTSKA